MTKMTHMTHARRAMTLVEVLLALAVTGMVAVTVLGMLGGLGTLAANEQRDRIDTTQREAGAMRLAAIVRASTMVLDADSQTIVLWGADANGDGQPNLSEIVRIERTEDGLSACRASDGLTEAEDLSWPVGSGLVAITQPMAGGASFPSRLIAPGVAGFAVVGVPADPTDATLVRLVLEYENTGGFGTVHVDASPRARAIGIP